MSQERVSPRAFEEHHLCKNKFPRGCKRLSITRRHRMAKLNFSGSILQPTLVLRERSLIFSRSEQIAGMKIEAISSRTLAQTKPLPARHLAYVGRPTLRRLVRSFSATPFWPSHFLGQAIDNRHSETLVFIGVGASIRQRFRPKVARVSSSARRVVPRLE